MQNLWAIIVITFASLYVVVLDYFAFSSRGLQKSLVLPIIILLIILYKAKVNSWERFINHQGKWVLLLWGSILIQTLVVATGGLQSPFLVLLHLSMIAISFLFSFMASAFFLLFSFLVLFIDISFNGDVFTYLTSEPSTFILQIVSLFSILPIAYIISTQYRLKEVLSNMLRAKVKADEAIIESLHEMIVITDSDLKILSVNDAVEQTVKKPRSELIQTPFLNALLIKDAEGKLATKEMFLKKFDDTAKEGAIFKHFTIINVQQNKNISIHMQKIQDLQTKTKQYSFVLSSDYQAQEASAPVTIEKARAKYDAMLQALKQIVQSGAKDEAFKGLLMVEKIENDLYNTQLYATSAYTKSLTNIDIAMLCKNIVDTEQAFANSFQIPIQFEIEDFGHKDIAHLTVKNFPVEPEQLTGPFFTLPCDVKASEILLRKLIDLTLFLASSSPSAVVKVVVKRTRKQIVIQIRTTNPNLKETQLKNLFVPSYGKLPTLTNVMAGSGLEGYLVQVLSEKMETPVSVHLDTSEKEIYFTWELKRRQEESKQVR